MHLSNPAPRVGDEITITFNLKKNDQGATVPNDPIAKLFAEGMNSVALVELKISGEYMTKAGPLRVGPLQIPIDGKLYLTDTLTINVAPKLPEGIINEPIAEHPTRKGYMTVWRKGKESITEYKVVENYRYFSWMEFRILTGRTHQIRVHMKHLGHPIVCDHVYGDGKPLFISQLKRE